MGLPKYKDVIKNFTGTDDILTLFYGKDEHKKGYKIKGLYNEKMDLAFKEGFQAGLEKALDEFRLEHQHKIDSMINSFNQQIDMIKSSLSNLINKYHNDTFKLALKIAKKIIGEISQKDNTAIIYNIKNAFKKVNKDIKITIKLHPDDMKYLNENSDILNSASKDAGIKLSNLELSIDKDIQKGGCVLVTDISSIDARLHEQFEELKRKLNKNYITIIENNGVK